MQTQLEAYPPQRERLLGPLYLTEPEPGLVATVVERMSEAEFTYDRVGETRGAMPDDWATDEWERTIGRGEGAWKRAIDALRRWVQFDLDWVSPHDPTVPLEPGATFAFVSQQLGIWSVNVCRVVYVIDEVLEDRRRFGFAYGTVGTHVLQGEERFLIELLDNDEVRFGIKKFSRPAHPLVSLAGPLARRTQRRFSVDAIERLQREADQ